MDWEGESEPMPEKYQAEWKGWTTEEAAKAAESLRNSLRRRGPRL
jgi:hypothetical protein